MPQLSATGSWECKSTSKFTYVPSSNTYTWSSTTGTATGSLSVQLPAGATVNSSLFSVDYSGATLYGGTTYVNGVKVSSGNSNYTFYPGALTNASCDFSFKSAKTPNYATYYATRTFACTFTVDYTPPSAPSVSGVTLGGSTATQYRGASGGIRLAWNAANGTNNPISSYTVQYSDNDGAWATYATGIGTGYYDVVAHPTAGNNRRFRVIAIAPYGNSAEAYSPYLYTYSAASAPTSVSVTPPARYTGETVTVSWSGASGGTGVGISRYEVYCNDILVGSTTALSLVVVTPTTAGNAVYKVKTIGTISGYNSGLSSASATVTVENPRSTGVLNKSSVSMDDTSTITITVMPSNAAYNHKVIWYTSSHTVTHNLDVGVTTDTLNPIPLAWCTAYPNATSGTANAKLETYNGATKIGELIYSFTVIVPTTVLPTVSALERAPVDGFTGLYLKGISKATLTATATGAQGSTIPGANYAMLGGGGTGNTNPWTTPILTTVGTNAMSVTVTDSRGRTATRTENITVTDYVSPAISSVLGERCTSGGTADNDGTCVKIKATLAVTSLSGNNPIALAKVEYRKIGVVTWTLGTNTFLNNTYSVIGNDTVAITDGYEIRILLTDTVGKSSTYITTILPSTRLYDFRNDRASIGRVAGAIPKQLVLPDDWTTNINADKLDGYDATAFLGASAKAVDSDKLEGSTLAQVISACLLASHPVGSIYESTESTSPETLFGGTWASMSAKFLIGADGTYTAGSTGGSDEHVHGLSDGYAEIGLLTSGYLHWRQKSTESETAYNNYITGTTYTAATNNGGVGVYLQGSTDAGSSMPPWESVYRWKRTA